MATIPQHVAALATHLSLAPPRLADVAEAIIHTAFMELKLNSAAQATIDLWIKDERLAKSAAGATDSAIVLARHFADQEQRERDPWRIIMLKLKGERELFSKKSDDDLKKDFLNACKSGMLTSDEVLLSTYLLYGNDECRRIYMSQVLRLRTLKERVTAHNFFVAAMLGDQWTTEHGEALSRLAWPLFPPDPEFEFLNTKLFAEVEANQGSTIQGGSARKSKTPSVFRDMTRGAVVGGGVLPVLGDGNGNFAVDVTPVEVAFASLQKEHASLKKHVANLQNGRGRGTSQQQPAATAPAQLPPYSPHQQRQQTPAQQPARPAYKSQGPPQSQFQQQPSYSGQTTRGVRGAGQDTTEPDF